MLPRIGITMGDAAGIGPEIIVKALINNNIYQICQPVVIGSATIIQHTLSWLSSIETSSEEPKYFPQVSVVQPSKEFITPFGQIDVVDVNSLSPDDFSLGTVNPYCGLAAIQSIEAAVKLTLDGVLDAITTAPICKASIQRAGSPYPGHTEMLAGLTNIETSVMMLKTWNTELLPKSTIGNATKKMNNSSTNTTNLVGDLTVSFVTNHIPISEVSQHISSERIIDVIQLTHDALVRFGIAEPRLVVTGLNPHAGEQGMFGKEEEETILPAIRQAASAGMHVDGPLPADTLFQKALRGDWDVVVAMYHDQGNIPIKLIGFGNVVNITLGLPIVRTSVDHGTAFDIAGQGVASESSLLAAIDAAAHLVSS